MRNHFSTWGCLLALACGWCVAGHAADLFKLAAAGDAAGIRRELEWNTEQLNARNGDDRTPLHLAVAAGRVAAVTVLLDAGSDLTARDARGMMPLHDAARNGSTDLVTLLIRRGADVNARDDEGWTPLHWAASLRHAETALALIDLHARVTARDGTGATPLHWAASGGQLALLQRLLAAGALVNAADNTGDTPLHWAAIAGQTDAATLLLQKGANLQAAGRAGRLPYALAEVQGYAALAALLRPPTPPPPPAASGAPRPPNSTALPGKPAGQVPPFTPPPVLLAPPTPPAPTTPAPRRALQAASTAEVKLPLAAQATALCADDGRLYLGLPGGGITIYTPARDTGVTVAPPRPTGPTRAIAAGSGTVWWLTQQPELLCAYREGADTITAYGLAGRRPDSPLSDDAAPSARLACWRGRLVICTPSGAQALDPATGELRELRSLLPAAIASALRGARLYFTAHGETALLAAARRDGAQWTVACWRGDGDAWMSLGTQTLADWQGVLALTPERLELIGRAAISGSVATAGGGQPHRIPYLTGAPRLPAAQWATCGPDTLWWGGGDVLFGMGADGASAYLPWNDPGVSVRCAAADAGGVWLATTRGVRRLTPGAPTPTLGYAGFIRLRLGAEATRPLTEADRTLAATIDTWQGTPYAWGGASRNGTDCSGFVLAAHQACGVALPHGSANLRGCPTGLVVRDELRYGDVLVFPGHAALYTGNGTTAETVRGAGVSRADVWRRRSVVVRRFLNQPTRPSLLLASRGGKARPAGKGRNATTAPRKPAHR